MENTFTPAVCLDGKTENGVAIPAPYKGTVTLRMPSFDERIAFYDNADVPMDLEGLPEAAQRVRNKKLIRHVAKQAKHHVVRVDIVRVEDGFKLDSLDALQHDTDMIAVMMEIATRLVGKFAVGSVGNVGSNSSPSTSPPSTKDTPDPGAQPTS